MGRFSTLSEVKVNDQKNVVVSSLERSSGDKLISIGQQLIFDNDGVKQGVFLKNAIVLEKEKALELANAIINGVAAISVK